MELLNYVSMERGRAALLARALRVPNALISQWANRRRDVPVERCPEIERATAGAVTRRDLRPDDWHLIWPELVTGEHPAPTSEAA